MISHLLYMALGSAVAFAAVAGLIKALGKWG